MGCTCTTAQGAKGAPAGRSSYVVSPDGPGLAALGVHVIVVMGVCVFVWCGN